MYYAPSSGKKTLHITLPYAKKRVGKLTKIL